MKRLKREMEVALGEEDYSTAGRAYRLSKPQQLLHHASQKNLKLATHLLPQRDFAPFEAAKQCHSVSSINVHDKQSIFTMKKVILQSRSFRGLIMLTGKGEIKTNFEVETLKQTFCSSHQRPPIHATGPAN